MEAGALTARTAPPSSPLSTPPHPLLQVEAKRHLASIKNVGLVQAATKKAADLTTRPAEMTSVIERKVRPRCTKPGGHVHSGALDRCPVQVTARKQLDARGGN